MIYLYIYIYIYIYIVSFGEIVFPAATFEFIHQCSGIRVCHVTACSVRLIPAFHGIGFGDYTDLLWWK